MRAELTVVKNGRPVAVLKGAKSWLESRALAYRLAGCDIVLSWVEAL